MPARAGSIGGAWGSRVTLKPWTNGKGFASPTTSDLTLFRYCQPCLGGDVTRSISHKPPIRKSSRKRATRDFVDQDTGTESNTNKWLKMLEGKPIVKESFKRMKGEDVCLAWLEQDPHAMEEPIVIETPEGLEMKMPPEGLSVADISEILGEATPIEVIGLIITSYQTAAMSDCVSYCRCIYPIEFPRLDYWKMGRLFFG